MGIPKDFNWKVYLKINPDLRSAGLKNEGQARYHYFNYGKKENRSYKLKTKLEEILETLEVYKGYDQELKDSFHEKVSLSVSEYNSGVDHKKYKCDEISLIYSLLDYEELLSFGVKDSTPKPGYSTSCVIAFKDRHKMVKLNVELLSKQSEKPAIILVVSNYSDFLFANELEKEFDNVFVVIHKNYPLGGKWQSGVDFSKKLSVKGVMILGSDDLLSLDYFKNCLQEIDYGYGSSRNGVDLIGNRSWYMYDTNKDLYSLSYSDSVKIFLGGGKMFSKNFLDKIDWVIFNRNLPRHLDDYGYEMVVKLGNSTKLISKENFIFSIKGPWEVMNKSENFISSTSKIKCVKMETDFTNELINKLGNLNLDELFK